MHYGFCPLCGADAVTRERGLNGNDTCRMGHVYPSRLTLATKPPAANAVLLEVIALLGNLERVLDFSKPMGETTAILVRGWIKSVNNMIAAHMSGPAAVGGWPTEGARRGA